MSNAMLSPCSAFTSLPLPLIAGSGVVAMDRDGLGIATVVVKRDGLAALTRAALQRFAVELPRGPRRFGSGDLAFIGLGPQTWLVTTESGGHSLAASLHEALGHCASICDQSGGYASLRVSGPRIRQALAKILPLDLHPRAFKVADCASTVALHIAATLWRLEDAPGGAPVFEILVPRSFAVCFWDLFVHSAAEYGLSAAG
jgi:heterotetrameric sarcosine oxidase gamma subunit